jgi:predicted tellurium resistance membrane protein TerC
VPLVLQHRVLFWGHSRAVVLRGVMIALGIALINRFDRHHLFGAFLLYWPPHAVVAARDRRTARTRWCAWPDVSCP